MIALSVQMFICLFVCGHKNEHFERSRPAYTRVDNVKLLASMYLKIESDL